MNVTSIEAKLMTIHMGFIPAMESDNIQDVITITDSIATATKILESHVNPFQNIALPLTSNIKLFLDKDRRNSIHFWYCLRKAK